MSALMSCSDLPPPVAYTPPGMTPALVRAALEMSITHWARLARGAPEPGIGAAHCALCALFFCAGGRNGCDGCPVAMRAGQHGCRGTPYGRAHETYWDHGADSDTFKAAAAEELAFLESLREPAP